MVLLAVAIELAVAGRAFALGDIAFPWRRHAVWPTHAPRVEVADAELYGVAGLRATGVRASVPVWRLTAAVELVRVGSDAMSESRATLYLAAGVVALEMGLERVTAGTRNAGLVSVGAMARLPAGSGAHLLFHATGLGVRGTYDPGFDAGVDIELRPVEAVTLYVGASIHRRYGESLRLSAEVRTATPLTLSAGFDAATETAGAGVRVSVRALSVEFGADVHAVLGVSQRVSLQWGR